MANLENETTIQFNDGEDVARIWSCQSGFHAKMKRLGVEPKRKAERIGTPFSAWYEVPLSWVNIRPPKKMNLTDEQRVALAARLQNARFGRSDTAVQGETDPIEENEGGSL